MAAEVKMNSQRRVLKELQILMVRFPQTVRTVEIAEELDVKSATASRDLKALKDAGFAWLGDDGWYANVGKEMCQAVAKFLLTIG